MVLNVFVPNSFGEPSPTRILLQDYKGLRGFTLLRKTHLFNECNYRSPSKSAHSSQRKLMKNRVFAATILAYKSNYFLDSLDRPLGCIFGVRWFLLAPFSFPFGSLWLPFGSLEVAFWFLLDAF